ncbi:MAG: SPOR domain-containing protein [Acidobacteriia bacterium]|nr:SPOR domain-containing protein [Terriglobia bacterium]
MMKRVADIFAGVSARTLWPVALLLSLAIPGPAQLLQPTLSVNGSPLITARPVTKVGQEWFLPLIPIAEALGVEIAISADGQELRAQHQNGTEITYDARTGQIRHGYVLVGQVRNYKQIQFAGPREDILFPLGGVVALLGVDVEEDPGHGVLRIEPSREGMEARSATAPAFSLTSLNYNYAYTTNTRDYSQSINLFGEGLAGITRLRGNMLFSRYPGQPRLNFSQGALRMELPRERKLVLGDQGIYSGIEALTNTVRGIGFEEPVRGYQFNVYGGQSMSATFGSLGGSFSRYDTGIAGFAVRKRSRTGELSLGGHYFSGDSRRGTAVGLAYGRLSTRNQFKSQVVIGLFSGLSASSVLMSRDQVPLSGMPESRTGTTLGGTDPNETSLTSPTGEFYTPIRVDGPAVGFTLKDTFTPIKRVSLGGQFDYYGRNFLTPRSDPRYSGQSDGALSVVFRPNRYTSLTAGINRREYLLGNRPGVSSRNFGALASLPGRYPVQIGFFRSEQTDSFSSPGKTSLTQFSLAMPKFSRYSAYAYYTEMEFAGQRSQHFNGIFVIDLKSRGRITLNDQLQSHSDHRLGLDWYLDLPRNSGFIRVGVDRITSMNASTGYSPLIGIRLPLPHGHSLEFTYYSDRDYRSLRVEVGGRLVRESAGTGSNFVSGSVVHRAPVTGRVFLDEDLNGAFDEAVERPVADVQVRMDGTQVAVTDARGLFRFGQVEPGAHTVQAGLEGLPADMIFADAQEKTIAVLPYRDNILNFRVVQTGRITGKVTYLDYSKNPEIPVERPLPDARITAGSRHDALSELNGIFLIGDLPPGTYELEIDRNTLPEGYAPKPASIQVVVKPGKTMGDVAFLLVIPPKPVVQKILPPQAAEPAVAFASEKAAAKETPVKDPRAGQQLPDSPQLTSASARPSPAAVSPLRPPTDTPPAKKTPASGARAVRSGRSMSPKQLDTRGGGGTSDTTARQSQGKTSGQFQLQIYAAQALNNVEERARKLRQSGFSCRISTVQIAGKGTWYRVRLVGLSSREDAIAAGELLIARGLTTAYWVVR